MGGMLGAVLTGDGIARPQVAAQCFPGCHEACKQFLRHKSTLMSPAVLAANGVQCCSLRQGPGEFIVTMPRAYHFGFNYGINCAESTNFALKKWLPLGHTASRCVCPHGADLAVIDMTRFKLAGQQPGDGAGVRADKRTRSRSVRGVRAEDASVELDKMEGGTLQPLEAGPAACQDTATADDEDRATDASARPRKLGRRAWIFEAISEAGGMLPRAELVASLEAKFYAKGGTDWEVEKRAVREKISRELSRPSPLWSSEGGSIRLVGASAASEGPSTSSAATSNLPTALAAPAAPSASRGASEFAAQSAVRPRSVVRSQQPADALAAAYVPASMLNRVPCSPWGVFPDHARLRSIDIDVQQADPQWRRHEDYQPPPKVSATAPPAVSRPASLEVLCPPPVISSRAPCPSGTSMPQGDVMKALPAMPEPEVRKAVSAGGDDTDHGVTIPPAARSPSKHDLPPKKRARYEHELDARESMGTIPFKAIKAAGGSVSGRPHDARGKTTYVPAPAAPSSRRSLAASVPSGIEDDEEKMLRRAIRESMADDRARRVRARTDDDAPEAEEMQPPYKERRGQHSGQRAKGRTGGGAAERSWTAASCEKSRGEALEREAMAIKAYSLAADKMLQRAIRLSAADERHRRGQLHAQVREQSLRAQVREQTEQSRMEKGSMSAEAREWQG